MLKQTIAALAVVGVLDAGAMADLTKPNRTLLDGKPADAAVTVAADGKVVLSTEGAASFVRLEWDEPLAADARVLGGMWERTYGDSAWRRVDDKTAPRKGTMPWYFLVNDGSRTDGYGVMVQPNAFACWTVSEKGIVLSLDVRAGLAPVRPRGRRIELCTLVSREGTPGESAFAAGRAFCRLMCPSPRLPKEQVYGYNDWYCAYGNNTATNFLADAAFIVSLLDRGEKVANRPFFVVDDGWQLKPQKGDAIGSNGQWCANNPRWGMPMEAFASKVKALDARPGLWYRPFHPDVGEKALPVDPTDPVWERNLRRDLARFRKWGFELVKIDFITWDWGQTWGYELGDSPCGPKACAWKDDAHTGAETVKRLYRAMREAAGDMYIIGCNAIDHFAAGLFELQRTGDDTDAAGRGRARWGRTRSACARSTTARFISGTAIASASSTRIPSRGRRTASGSTSSRKAVRRSSSAGSARSRSIRSSRMRFRRRSRPLRTCAARANLSTGWRRRVRRTGPSTASAR